MADILIRGMTTPKEPTPLTLYPDGRWNDYTDGANGEFFSLPEGHGKLGDLDVLDKFIHEKETKAAAEEFYLGEAWYNTFRQIVRLMQTIVPPEGGTDNG